MNYPKEIDPITLAKIDKQPHDPVDVADDREAEVFNQKLIEFANVIENELLRMGFAMSDLPYEADYYGTSNFGAFRVVSYVIFNEAMASSEVIDRIGEIIRVRFPDYMIALSNEFEDDLQLFSIYLTKSKAIGWFETLEMAEQCGFDGDSSLIGPMTYSEKHGGMVRDTEK